MKTVRPSPLLMFALRLDAVVSGALGLLQLAPLDPLAGLLQLPRGALLATGEFLLVYALLLAVLSWRDRLWSSVVMLVVAGNLAWGFGCVALLGSGALATNALGVTFLLGQAVAVTVFAALQGQGLRRSRPADGQPSVAAT